MGLGGQRHAPVSVPPGKTRYPLYRRLDGPQSRSGQVREISPLPGFDPARSESLYRLSYPGSPSMWVSSLILQSYWGNLPPNNSSSTHNSRLLEEQLWRQADIEFTEWSPRSHDLNTLECM